MKKLHTVLALLAAAAALSAQQVAEDELQSVSDRTIEFINYEGPHARVDTLEEIRGLGASLGREAASGATRAGDEARYAVIRVRDTSTPEGLNADILILGKDAQVDHIRNLRHILGAYLETAYGYPRKDAYLLATFLTVYNAVYRGDLAYFGKAYKPAVSTYLTAENAGLSVRYDEWPGRSRIVLPITSRLGAGKLDTGPITEKPVVEGLKKESGTEAIPERQDMVDLKEREVETRKAELEAKKAEVAAQEKAVAEEKASVESARTDLEAAKTAPGEKGPEQEATLTQREAEVAAQEAVVAEKEQGVAASKEEIAKEEKAIAAKEEEIASDRKGVAQDQKTEIAKEVAAKSQTPPKGSVILDLVDPNLPYARLALVDLTDGRYLKTGDLNTLRADSLLDVGGAFVAVAGRASGSGAVRLVLLDTGTLSAKVTGSTDVHPQTGLWKDGPDIFAVASKGDGKWVLGLFDPTSLTLKQTSEAEVSPFTFFTIVPEGIVVANAKGGLLLLGRKDLKTLKEIQR